jgi:hypothetical protein
MQQPKLRNSLVRFASAASVAAITICFLGCECSAGEVPNQTEKGWAIKQNHCLLQVINVYVVPSALRIDNLDGGFSVIACAPKWDAIIFRPKEKVFFRTSYQDWLINGFQAIELAFSTDEKPINPTTTATHALGFAAQVLKWKSYMQRSGGLSTIQGDKVPCTFEYLLGTSETFPRQVSELLQRFYKLPIASGFPLWLKASNYMGQHFELLTTQQASRMDLSQDLFKEPSGFKAAKSEMAIIVDQSTRGEIEEWGRMMNSK